mgnify:CR=1 FL=1|jgi:acetylornithine deacetylase
MTLLPLHNFFQTKLLEQRAQITQLISDLVRIPSVNDESRVQAYIESFLDQYDLQIDSWEPSIKELCRHPAFVPVDYGYANRKNMVVILKGLGGGPSLTLNGHMDVVPSDPTATWKHADPFSGKIENNRVYGRGSVDMKAGLAIMMIIAKVLRELQIQLKGDLQLQFVVDEENGGNGTLACITRGYRSDATIFLEPTSPNYLVVSSRGAHFFRISVPGVEGGIEYQYLLPNAIEKAALIIKAVQHYALWRASQANSPLYEHDPTKIPAAICKIQAGNWPSTLPAKCILEGSIECLPGEDIDQICDQFTAFIKEVARHDPWMRDHPPQVEWFGLRYEAGLTDPNHPFVQTLLKVITKTLGGAPQVVGGGGSDLRLPVLYAQSASVLFGPSGGAIHSTDEFVDLDSVMEVLQVIGNFILEWCQLADNE